MARNEAREIDKVRPCYTVTRRLEYPKVSSKYLEVELSMEFKQKRTSDFWFEKITSTATRMN